MAECEQCGTEETFPYECNWCGGTMCSEHRLPENHACDRSLVEAGDGGGKHNEPDSTSVTDRVRDSLPAIGVGGLSGKFSSFEQNMTFVFLGLMWATFAAQVVIINLFGNEAATSVFVLHSENLEYVWTWFTSIFAHGGLWHLAVNSIVLVFFGPLTERRIGTKRFVLLFLAAGAIAGLAQAGATAALSSDPSGVVGASGAIAAVLGLLTVLNPRMTVYLWFILPMPLWVITGLFAGYSVLMSVGGGIGAGGVAQLAHLMGVVVGVLYGFKLKRDGIGLPDTFHVDRGTPNGKGRPGNRP